MIVLCELTMTTLGVWHRGFDDRFFLGI